MGERPHYNEQDARDALQVLDPDCDRELWVKVAMAAKEAGLDLADFDAWSATASTYSKRDTRDVWNSAKAGGGVGAGTLFWEAKQAGWRGDGRRTSTMSTKAARTTAEHANRSRLGMSAIEVWDRCTPATAAHGYIRVKEGLPTDLRVVPDGDPLTVAGVSMVGALVVPITPLSGGDPVSLQFIAPPDKAEDWTEAIGRTKLNLPGASMHGVFVVGQTESAGTVYLCEGIGQAWACWKGAGHAAVVCFGWGRVRNVAAEMRLRNPAMKLVLVPDVGKETEAQAIARDVRGLVAYMPVGWKENSDVNDLGLRDGFDMVEDILCRATQPPAAELRFKLLRGADLYRLPHLIWRVHGVLPASGLACVYGPSGSGKSFLVLDMAARIAEGGDWFGYRVTPCPVVYICLEGAAGLRQRVAAWEVHNGRELPRNLHLVVDPFKLTNPQDVQDMGAAVLSTGAGAVTFIDTLNASAPGVDENASHGMGSILEAAKTLQSMTSGLVTFVHHTGKNEELGLRGHSSLLGALDAAIAVSDRRGRQWRVAKSKDGANGGIHAFALDEVYCAPDDYGELTTSCVVRSLEFAPLAARVEVPQGKNQMAVFTGLKELFKAGTVGKPGAPPDRPCIEMSAAVSAGATTLGCRTDKRTSSSRQAIEGLIGRGVLGRCDGWVWLP